MAFITLESRAVSFGNGAGGDTGFDHLYLVFNDNGQETVIRGGPFFGLPPFGALVVEVGVPIDDSEDNRDVQSNLPRGNTVLDHGGRDAAEVWQVLLQAAQQIQDARVDYDLNFDLNFDPMQSGQGTNGSNIDISEEGTQNSNSLIAAVLARIGIDVNTYLPLLPGDNNVGSFNTIDEVEYTLTADSANTGQTLVGGEAADVFRGGSGDDTFIGGDGVDTVRYDVEPAGPQAVSDSDGVTIGFSTGQNANSSFVQIDVSDARFGGLDVLQSIERIQTSSRSDTVEISDGFTLPTDLTIDGGSDVDTVSFSDTGGVVDLGLNNEGIIFEGRQITFTSEDEFFSQAPDGLTFINFEQILLSEGADTVSFGSSLPTGDSFQNLIINGNAFEPISGRDVSDISTPQIRQDSEDRNNLANFDTLDFSGLSTGLNFGTFTSSTLVNQPTAFGFGRQELVDGLEFRNFEVLNATSHDDNVVISTNDTIQEVNLGAGNDTLVRAASGTVVRTGSGNDTIYFSNNVLVEDLSADDRVSLFGVINLGGGVRNANSESPYAAGAFGELYGLNQEGQLVISHSAFRNIDGSLQETFIDNPDVDFTTPFGQRTGGIVLAEFSIEAARLIDAARGDVDFNLNESNEALLKLGLDVLATAATGEDFSTGLDPLVLDLDGDGIELSAENALAPSCFPSAPNGQIGLVA